MKKITAKGVLGWITPGRAIARAASSINHTKGVLAETAEQMKAGLPGQAKPGTYEEGDVRNISDAKLRYQTMYQMHNWTPAEIAKQKRTLQVTKIVAFVMAILSIAGVIILGIVAPRWMSFILVPIGGCTLILGMAKGFQFALFHTQMDLEEFISAREFVSRPDFFNRLLG